MIVGHVSCFSERNIYNFFFTFSHLSCIIKKEGMLFCEGRKLYEKNFGKRNFMYIICIGIVTRLAGDTEWCSCVGRRFESGNHNYSNYGKLGTGAGMGAVSVSGI